MQVAPRPHPPHHSYSQAYPMDHLQPSSPQQSHHQSQSSQVATHRKRKRQGLNGSQVTYRSEYESDRFGEMREYIVIEDTPPPDLPGLNLPPGLAPTPSQASSVATSVKPKTRLQAQIAAAASGSQPLGPASSAESSGTFNAPPSKRRKRDTVDDTTPVAHNGAVAGPSTGAHARKAMAGRAYESQQLKPYPSGSNWMNAGSGGGTESVRASQVSVASTQIQTPVTPSYDDKDGYYIITPGDLVKDRCAYLFATAISHSFSDHHPRLLNPLFIRILQTRSSDSSDRARSERLSRQPTSSAGTRSPSRSSVPSPNIAMHPRSRCECSRRSGNAIRIT